jgi:hypothetical protein
MAIFPLIVGPGFGLDLSSFGFCIPHEVVMAEQALLVELARRLGDILPGKAASEDLEKSVNAVVQSVFSRLELVTREDFDAQLSVLNRTRERVQQLETELEQMRRQLDTLQQ